MIGENEFVERPARKFHYTIINGRLKARLCLLRHGVRDFIERIADGNLGGNLRYGVSRRFRCQRRGTADARIDLDDIVAIAVRIECILRVAAAFDIQFTDDAERRTAQHLIVMIGQRLRRCNNDAVSRMYTDGIEVLHVADRDAVVIAVTHDFILNFFPTGNAALDEHLADHAVLKSLDDRFDKFFFVFGNAAARAAHRVGGTHDQRIADLVGKPDGRFHILDDRALRNRLFEFLHRFLEKLAVFRLLNRLKACSQEFDMIFFQHAFFGEFDGKIQTGLPAKGSKKSVGQFFGDDFLKELHRQRLDINAVGNMRIRHDRCRVAVDENDFKAFFFQGAACL